MDFSFEKSATLWLFFLMLTSARPARASEAAAELPSAPAIEGDIGKIDDEALTLDQVDTQEDLHNKLKSNDKISSNNTVPLASAQGFHALNDDFPHGADITRITPRGHW